MLQIENKVFLIFTLSTHVHIITLEGELNELIRHNFQTRACTPK